MPTKMTSNPTTSEGDAAPLHKPTARTAKRSSSKGSSLPWTLINFWLDVTLGVVFLAVVWTSTIVRFVFPPAVNARDWSLWSWSVDQWIAFQYVLICVLTFLVLVHVMLHWSWVCGVIASRFLRSRDGKKRKMDEGVQTIVGVGLMIVLLNIMGLGIAAAMLMVDRPL